MHCHNVIRLTATSIAAATALLLPAGVWAHGVPAATATATPGAISPDGDGQADAARVAVRVARTSLLTTTVLHAGKVVRRLPSARVRAGVRSVSWDGSTDAGTPATAGAYVLRIALRDPSKHWRIVTAELRVAPMAVVPPAGPVTAALQWPIAGSVSSPFGPRNGRMHDGIDIPAPSMTPIGAAAAGTVRQAGHVEGYGLTVTVDHADGTATLYAHQAQVGVAAGAVVTAGQVIGHVGRTGSSTTDHLHFEVHDSTGAAVDPLLHLPLR